MVIKSNVKVILFRVYSTKVFIKMGIKLLTLVKAILQLCNTLLFLDSKGYFLIAYASKV